MRPSLAFAALALLSAPRPSVSQTGRPLTIEDYYRVRTVGAPRIPPSGAWVAYTVTSRVEATNADPSEVWVADSEGRTPSPSR